MGQDPCLRGRGPLVWGGFMLLMLSEFKQVNVHKFQSLLNTDIIRKSPFPSRMFSCLYSYMPVHFLKERKKKKSGTQSRK